MATDKQKEAARRNIGKARRRKAPGRTARMFPAAARA